MGTGELPAKMLDSKRVARIAREYQAEQPRPGDYWGRVAPPRRPPEIGGRFRPPTP